MKIRKEDELLDSNYDGIQEYDNDLPRWWLMLFYGTMIFAVVFCCYYFYFGGLTSKQDFESAKSANDQLIAKNNTSTQSSGIQPEKIKAMISDVNFQNKGKEIFVQKCAACHGQSGEGLVGPNLVDKYWIHGGTIEKIQHTIEVGVPEKGMLAWKGLISDEDIVATVAYIRSIADTNPPNAKAPQGDLYIPNEVPSITN